LPTEGSAGRVELVFEPFDLFAQPFFLALLSPASTPPVLDTFCGSPSVGGALVGRG
jgi:hypothetical protein